MADKKKPAKKNSAPKKSPEETSKSSDELSLEDLSKVSGGGVTTTITIKRAR
jgi:hypothetical protein